MVFNITVEDLRHKAWLVTESHMTKAPAAITYVSIVLRETVRITLTFAALNDFEMKSAEIRNANVQAHVTEKM